jgi:uncharacterized protein
MFSERVTKELGCYVYRLIDPRNGETFYVGKGNGNRVFNHAADKLKDEDIISEKLLRIRQIRNAGFEVEHVIHRHGLDNDTAVEIEAALLDAYPGTTNIAGGHHSGDRGAMHAKEVVAKYEAKIADFKHPMLAIIVNRSAEERNLYDAVRFAWRLDRERAKQAQFVLAVRNGVIIGVFRPTKWMEATKENFPGFESVNADHRRLGFEGDEAPEDIKRLYKDHRMPDEFRKRGAASPVRYINII